MLEDEDLGQALRGELMLEVWDAKERERGVE